MYPQYICILLYVWNLFGVPCYSIHLLSIRVWGVDVSSVFVYSTTCENLFSVLVFHRHIVNWSVGGRCILSICVFCSMWNLFGVTVFHRSIVNYRVRGRCILSICAFCYMWNLFGVMVFHRHIVNWSVGVDVVLSICAFCYMWNLFGVMVFQ